MTFHDIRFPPSISFGSTGGPERRTEIVTLTNGFEERNTPWAASRRRYDAGLGVRTLDDIAAIVAFFEARQGELIGFRWKDWTDFKSCAPSSSVAFDDQTIGTGSGAETVFPLVKRYTSGTESYARAIAKPVAGSVKIGVDGIELSSGFAVDPASGDITFDTPPSSGATVTAGFEFDVPVRFDTDRIVTSAAGFEAGEIPSVPVVEIRV